MLAICCCAAFLSPVILNVPSELEWRSETTLSMLRWRGRCGARFLLELGKADPNRACGDGCTPLMAAVCSAAGSSISIVRLLLEQKDIELDKAHLQSQYTAFHYACSRRGDAGRRFPSAR